MTAALALGGCATPGYNPSRLQSQLVEAGTTAAQARCVTNGLSDQFAETQLGSHSEPRTDPDPTKDEFRLTRDILKRCKVTLPLQPPP